MSIGTAPLVGGTPARTDHPAVVLRMAAQARQGNVRLGHLAALQDGTNPLHEVSCHRGPSITTSLYINPNQNGQ
jgi:hypothetical protein